MKRRHLFTAVGCLLAAGSVSAQTVPVGNTAGNPQAIAIGTNSTAGPCMDQVFSSTSPCLAVGYGATANAPGASAVGWNSNAQGRDAVAIGTNAFAGKTGVDGGSVMVGNQVAIGAQAIADGYDAVTVGSSRTVGNLSTTVGNASSVTGGGSTSLGNTNQIVGDRSTALGGEVQINADGAVGIGSIVSVTGDQAIAIGMYSTASGVNSTAMGPSSAATDEQSVALGANARAGAYNCVALGTNSTCDESNTVSLGGASLQRRITNVSNGQANTDAATVGQLRGAAYAIGGGSYIDASGNYIAPTLYLSSGYTYTDLTSAIYDLDGRLWNLENATPVEPGEPSAPAPQPTAVVAGSNIQTSTDDQGNTTVSLSDNVQLSDQGSVQVGSATLNGQGLTIQGGPSITTQGVDAGNRRVTSVADGEISSTSTDAVNGRQLYQVQQDWDDRWEATNARIDRLDDRMNALGAKSAAMAQMAAASTPLAVGEAAVTAGAGFSSNRSALAVGYRLRVSERTSLSAGFAVGGGSSAMAGVGVQINLGR